jgi:hypothetical protein
MKTEYGKASKSFGRLSEGDRFSSGRLGHGDRRRICARDLRWVVRVDAEAAAERHGDETGTLFHSRAQICTDEN